MSAWQVCPSGIDAKKFHTACRFPAVTAAITNRRKSRGHMPGVERVPHFPSQLGHNLSEIAGRVQLKILTSP